MNISIFDMLHTSEFSLYRVSYLKQIREFRMKRGESKDFSEILEQVLGLGKISREKFLEIIEMTNKKKLSSREFFKLLDIIEKQ